VGSGCGWGGRCTTLEREPRGKMWRGEEGGCTHSQSVDVDKTVSMPFAFFSPAAFRDFCHALHVISGGFCRVAVITQYQNGFLDFRQVPCSIEVKHRDGFQCLLRLMHVACMQQASTGRLYSYRGIDATDRSTPCQTLLQTVSVFLPRHRCNGPFHTLSDTVTDSACILTEASMQRTVPHTVRHCYRQCLYSYRGIADAAAPALTQRDPEENKSSIWDLVSQDP
jgi:hypothetical protein